MSIITKKVTMTESAWNALKVMLDDAHVDCERFYGTFASLINISDAQTALAEAETVAISETYSEDRWAADATDVGVTPDIPPAYLYMFTPLIDDEE